MRTTIKSLEQTIGTLSAPSKMPCFSFSIPASECKVGSRLRKIEKSTCAKCYAHKGFYGFPSTRKSLANRFDKLNTCDFDLWVASMTQLILKKEKSGFFRWHDSGDVQTVEHLERIVQVAKNLPQISFWIPTREFKICKEYIDKNGKFPENLTVRLSSWFRESAPSKKFADSVGAVSSTVGYKESAHECPAGSQGNKCLDCRACWDKSIPNVDYPLH
jgi:hypothetical protein